MKAVVMGLFAHASAQDLFLALRSDGLDSPALSGLQVEASLETQIPLQQPEQRPFKLLQSGTPMPPPKARALPTVTAHGMGDSCFNLGFEELTRLIGKQTKQYAVCIPTGSNIATDTTNGFFMDMDKNVDVFARKIREDPKLAKGFHCIGLSQGNSLCRGYIHKYNDPPVATFISVHGTVAGVAAFPHCRPDGLLGPVCKPLVDVLGVLAYTPLSQKLLFQAGYFRDPLRVTSHAYKAYSQIAQWNNEGLVTNATYKDNFGKVKKFVMVKAEKDTMIYPNEGEWWGQCADGSLDKVLTMKESPLYQNDNFGLKTADEAGKIAFTSTKGDHLEFADAELAEWIDLYYTE